MYRDPVPKNSWVFLTEGRGGGKDTGYRIQKILGLAACLLAGRVVELRPGPGSSRPKYLCCTLAPHLPDWNSASPAYPMVKKPVSC